MDELLELFPKAVAWAEDHSAQILKEGRSLTVEEMEAARRVGVQHPESVRISEVTELPKPEDEELRAAALSIGLLGPTMIGLTLGYGIYLVRGNETRFIPHELRHVYQFERLGSISNFLTVYLQELQKFGYANAPLEVDASRYEPV